MQQATLTVVDPGQSRDVGPCACHNLGLCPDVYPYPYNLDLGRDLCPYTDPSRDHVRAPFLVYSCPHVAETLCVCSPPSCNHPVVAWTSSCRSGSTLRAPPLP